VQPLQVRSQFVVLIRDLLRYSLLHTPYGPDACTSQTPVATATSVLLAGPAHLPQSRSTCILIALRPRALLSVVEPWHTQTVPKNYHHAAFQRLPQKLEIQDTLQRHPRTDAVAGHQEKTKKMAQLLKRASASERGC
jgi:hypothetical protein